MIQTLLAHHLQKIIAEDDDEVRLDSAFGLVMWAERLFRYVIFERLIRELKGAIW